MKSPNPKFRPGQIIWWRAPEPKGATGWSESWGIVWVQNIYLHLTTPPGEFYLCAMFGNKDYHRSGGNRSTFTYTVEKTFMEQKKAPMWVKKRAKVWLNSVLKKGDVDNFEYIELMNGYSEIK